MKQLLDYLESYEKEVGNGNLKEFSVFLKDKVINNEPANGKSEFEPEKFQLYKSFPEIEFSTLLTELFRFAKHYVKKAFEGTSLKTLDEFGFLATLLRKESLLKNELIRTHLLEISSGSEVIKRLVKNGLIKESTDKNDKRAKRVSLTPKGVKEIMNAFGSMHKVSEIIIGNLTSGELTEALFVFNKLKYFHQRIHDQDKNTCLSDLHDKYIEQSVKSELS
jgi:DNA-binding MarR family transcriptional regulator